jgi:ElaB/YqjD/DUF883 family membrane-anchored ribosome-binding protein
MDDPTAKGRSAMDRTTPRSTYATDYDSDFNADESKTDKAKQTANKAKDKASAATDTAKEKASRAKAQASEKADAGMDQAASGVDKLADTIRDKAESSGDGGAMGAVSGQATMVADKLDQASGYLREKDSDELINDLESLVRRKPMESVAVAVGVGFLLSKAFR